MPLIADEIETLVDRARNDERVHLHGVDWYFYEAVLAEVGNGHTRVTYDRGELEMLAPSNDLAEDRSNSDWLILKICDVLRLNHRGQRNRTWRRKDLDCGLEADGCFYIQNYYQVPRRTAIELPASPPPDLVIDFDISRNSINKQRVYEKLGMCELWRDCKGRLVFFGLRSGKYEVIHDSLAFPGLTAADVERFLKSFYELGSLDATDALCKWVRKNLKKLAGRSR